MELADLRAQGAAAIDGQYDPRHEGVVDEIGDSASARPARRARR